MAQLSTTALRRPDTPTDALRAAIGSRRQAAATVGDAAEQFRSHSAEGANCAVGQLVGESEEVLSCWMILMVSCKCFLESFQRDGLCMMWISGRKCDSLSKSMFLFACDFLLIFHPFNRF